MDSVVGEVEPQPLLAMPTHTISPSKTSPASSVLRSDAGKVATRNALIHRYLPLVGKVVGYFMSRLPDYADFEELHSIGTLGLLSAIDRYDPAQKQTFGGYAQMRIRGAILDELRRMDSLPRSRRKNLRRIQKAISALEQQHGRAPYDTEIAAALEMTLAEFDALRSRVQPPTVVSLDSTLSLAGSADSGEVNFHETIADEHVVPVADRLERKEMVHLLGQVLEQLPDRQRDVLVMYYYKGMRLSEIATVFGVTEARICQIHTQALGSMRQHLKRID